jgi:hypothetical protein
MNGNIGFWKFHLYDPLKMAICGKGRPRMNVKTSIGLFISPRGEIFPVRDSHIGTLISESEKFGLTRAEIEAAYLRHGERIGVEGEARKELLLQIIRLGWIRIRRYPNKYWSVTAASLTPVVQELLRDWARKMLSGINGFKEADRYMPVKVSTLDGEFKYSIGDLADALCLW